MVLPLADDGSEEAKEIGGHAHDAADEGEKATEPSKGAIHLFHRLKANNSTTTTNHGKLHDGSCKLENKNTLLDFAKERFEYLEHGRI